jgi:phosphate/sulfate permease
LTGWAEASDRSKISILISFIFIPVIAGYTSAFGYSAAQAAASPAAREAESARALP